MYFTCWLKLHLLIQQLQYNSYNALSFINTKLNKGRHVFFEVHSRLKNMEGAGANSRGTYRGSSLTHSRRVKADLTDWLHKWLQFVTHPCVHILFEVTAAFPLERWDVFVPSLIWGWPCTCLVNRRHRVVLCQVQTPAPSGVSHIHLLLLGLRTCYLKIGHLGMLYVLSLRSLKKWQNQRGPFFFLRQVIKSSYEGYPLWTHRAGASLSPTTKGHQEECSQTGLARFPLICYNYFRFLNLSYSSPTVHSSPNLA